MANETTGAVAGETPQGATGQEKGHDGGERKPTDAEAALLKENMAFKKKLQAIEKAQAEAEEKRLKDQGEFKTIAEQAQAKAKAAQEKLKLAILKNTAAAAGLIDPDLVAIADLSAVGIDDDGVVTGAAEAIEAFRAAKPHLFGQQSTAPRPTTTPKPNGTTATPGPTSFSEWEAMPAPHRTAWAEKNAEAFARLCAVVQASPVKRF
jgi:hypothetical protein